MECYPAGIDSRNARWRGNNHPLCRVFMQIMEKGCFACARLPREKNIAPGVLNKVVGEFQFMVWGSHSSPGHALIL